MPLSGFDYVESTMHPASHDTFKNIFAASSRKILAGFIGTYAHFWGVAGSLSVKVVPSPTLLSTVNEPPWASAIRLQIASPNPIPLGFVVTRASRVASTHPQPCLLPCP